MVNTVQMSHFNNGYPFQLDILGKMSFDLIYPCGFYGIMQIQSIIVINHFVHSMVFFRT